MSLGVYKLVILGRGGVGKSALAIRFIQNIFIDIFDPTIEDAYRKQAIVDNVPCLMEILDTAENEIYPAMRDEYLRASKGFMITYSITSRESFNEISSFRELILRVKGTNIVPIILVGNKNDLETTRVVTRREGEELAKSFGCPFFETSAKDNIHVENSFHQLVREINKDINYWETRKRKETWWIDDLSNEAQDTRKKRKKWPCSLM